MSLPELTRIMWASAHARNIWESRIQAVSRAWQAVEFESVAQGLRTAALTTIASESLPEMTAKFASRGLVLQTVARVARSGSYSVAEQAPFDGQPWDYRVLVLDPRAVQIAQEVWATTGPERDDRIGALLGFPLCCRQFFRRVWVDQGLRDTTFSMAWANPEGPAECNILLRWLGVRLVPHLPCSFGCDLTLRQGQQFASLMPEQERRWTYEMLRWPMRWTAKNGIAELETPCFKVNMTTDVNAERQEVRRQGVAPAEGATGIRFPYNQPCASTVLVRLVDKRLWMDNGFSSKEAMDAAHQMILDALKPVMIDAICEDVLDLGAGNGTLLKKILGDSGGIEGVGIEFDRGRVERGRAAGLNIIAGRIENVSNLLTKREHGLFGVALISQRRFEEMSVEELTRTWAWLREHVHHVLLYSYEEPMWARIEVLHGTVHAH